MKLREFYDTARSMESTAAMPVLFAGHGSPMNAIENNEFTRGWQAMVAGIPRPAAILCISAHWETRGILVTSMSTPRTIHDFGGFPQELYEVQYPAPGSPELASEIHHLLESTSVGMDDQWGLDHGSWSVIRKMYPDASIPVVQLSIDYRLNPREHYDLAKGLASLRGKGVLIIGSGNMVHNLRLVDWKNTDKGYDWADEANALFKGLILRNEHQKLADYLTLGAAVRQSVPTPEHFLPLLYALAMQSEKDEVSFFNDRTLMGSLSMTSVKISPIT
ncbi:MAG TPA: 4,5-DOPA dioxygenase extradiol [Bacteroidales bacterium]|nr:4,5-DOPA dioxygenase extradiol [Bacteroidales bacterium]HPS62683.1 4,5-DOPA dioxygenase extradiol [Bacteroidales bacterium]